MSKEGKLRYQRKREARAALFWGECIVLLDAGKYEDLRHLFCSKAKQRLADVETISQMLLVDPDDSKQPIPARPIPLSRLASDPRVTLTKPT